MDTFLKNTKDRRNISFVCQPYSMLIEKYYVKPSMLNASEGMKIDFMLVEYAVNLQLLCYTGVILKKHGSGMTVIEMLLLSRNTTC